MPILRQKLHRSKGALACALFVAIAALPACTHVQPYQRAKLAHPTMSTDSLDGPGEEHMHAVHEGATGGGGVGGGGCGCN